MIHADGAALIIGDGSSTVIRSAAELSMAILSNSCVKRQFRLLAKNV
jgi:hypothetical protein